jgi:hypothetical protein
VKLLIDVIGWAGAGAVLAAYGLVSSRRMDPVSSGYQGLNVVGAAGLMINTFYYAAYPSTALNAIWALIAVGALWRLWAARRTVGP